MSYIFETIDGLFVYYLSLSPRPVAQVGNGDLLALFLRVVEDFLDLVLHSLICQLL